LYETPLAENMALMQTVKGLEQLDRLPPGTTISIGNFDGVHLGHQALLKMAGGIGAGPGKLMVVTFEPHPLTVLRPKQAPPRLTPPLLKHRLLAEAGVDYLLELAPTPEVLDLSAEAFWAILRDRLAPAALVEGSSFTFGKGRGGNIESLRQWTAAAYRGKRNRPAAQSVPGVGEQFAGALAHHARPGARRGDLPGTSV
jgi:FAD synthase